MSSVQPRIIALDEYETKELAHDALDDELGLLLWDAYSTQIEVSPPSFMNRRHWQLTPKGYVGQIPLMPDLQLVLLPRVPVANLFRMLEYAYRLAEFDAGLVSTDSLQDVYESLAVILARRVQERARRGLYRAYVPREDDSTYVRGRLDLQRLASAPWDPRVHCAYRLHSPDIDDNQILAWTMMNIVRGGVCREQRLPSVRQAFRQLQHTVTLEPVRTRDCLGRSYNRLNDDYRSLHALCHFFLDTSGPTHTHGDHTMIPFLINMPQIFEAFVARWLEENLPPRYRVLAQYPESLSADGTIVFKVDLVIWDDDLNRPACVMDTKYKAESQSGDLQQAIAYAQAIGCQEAMLIYPAPLGAALEVRAQDIAVRDLTFDLSGDLDEAGNRMLGTLLARIEGANITGRVA